MLETLGSALRLATQGWLRPLTASPRLPESGEGRETPPSRAGRRRYTRWMDIAAASCVAVGAGVTSPQRSIASARSERLLRQPASTSSVSPSDFTVRLAGFLGCPVGRFRNRFQGMATSLADSAARMRIRVPEKARFPIFGLWLLHETFMPGMQAQAAFMAELRPEQVGQRPQRHGPGRNSLQANAPGEPRPARELHYY